MIGENPSDAAHLALGAGERQSATRRVAICDLAGDLPALRSLIDDDDPHGIVDSFQYGISLNRIAYRVGDEGNLYVMPSGTDPDIAGDLVRSERWQRVSGGFRDVGALLLIVVRADTPGLAELVSRTDGAIVAGRARGLPADARVIAVAESRRAKRSSRPGQKEVARQTARRIGRMPGYEGEPGRGWTIALSVLVVLLVGGAMWWWSFRQKQVAAAAASPTPAGATSAADSIDLPFADDPADSTRAAAYGIELVKLNTLAGAILKVDAEANRLPAVTYAPTRLGPDGARWYVILAGAFRQRREADSLLAALRERAILDSAVGSVVRLPYALLLESDISRSSAPAVVRSYRARDLPAYAMIADDGTARVYAGAFETPAAAADLASIVDSAGLRPVIVYRTGRPF